MQTTGKWCRLFTSESKGIPVKAEITGGSAWFALRKGVGMAQGLQQLRKAAGYKTAREFGEWLGMSESTYARYESDPAGIPMRSAWRIADELGCTIDEVVGREAPPSASSSIQERYLALDAEGRTLVEEIVEFAEIKCADRQASERRAREREVKSQFTYYLLGFMNENAEEGHPVGAGEGGTPEFRAGFVDYAMRSIAEKGVPVEEGVTEYEDVIRAYDAWVSGDFFEPESAG